MSAPVILVVGGAGYVGAHTCKALKSEGFEPVVFDNFSTGHRRFVKWGSVIEGDIRDSAQVEEALLSSGASAVLHFAAHAYVGESVRDPYKYYDNNVSGTIALLHGMTRAKCMNLVFSSTCAIYGEPKQNPILENTTPMPLNPYGASKLMVERILADFQHAYGLTSSCLRYFNACGADPDGEIGEDRDPETHLIPRAMMSLLGQIDDFEIFGSDFPTPDGTAIRDYIHVSDLAVAHVVAVRRHLEGREGISVNLGTGQGFSVKEVLNAIEAETGINLPAVSGPRRPGDPAVLVADTAQARMLLTFDPKYSDLSTIIKTAWSWHKNGGALAASNS